VVAGATSAAAKDIAERIIMPVVGSVDGAVQAEIDGDCNVAGNASIKAASDSASGTTNIDMDTSCSERVLAQKDSDDVADNTSSTVHGVSRIVHGKPEALLSVDDNAAGGSRSTDGTMPSSRCGVSVSENKSSESHNCAIAVDAPVFTYTHVKPVMTKRLHKVWSRFPDFSAANTVSHKSVSVSVYRIFTICTIRYSRYYVRLCSFCTI
jgi:hypothetical protein